MGVPKFFRWLSERYPAISQLIAENRIPEFDCLYLDMNGIIHNCTHSDSDSPTHRITEEKMFMAIFNYIEHLFGKIKPQKVFFMAIDGVAPRAKMNQQRSRRFRTALDAEKARDKAVKEGVAMPSEPPFDSNCITPGTDFMARLTKQLKYFISKKISEDTEWQGVEIILSGHEVPGEGEHKIMEYIRLARAQPYYNANMRHCLYGLDADLIMLGLLSHDPHFCLLREEVTFGRESHRRSKELEHQKFYLMHLCIVREYLALEVQELQVDGTLSFEFDMEKVIDDFILMAFFVGNDFLPNLPNLHINEGALALMWSIYKKVLPELGGYLNERGVINLERLGCLLDELSNVEYRFFEADNADASWLKDKQTESQVEGNASEVSKAVPRTMTSLQHNLLLDITTFVHRFSTHVDVQHFTLPSNLKASDRAFVQNLARALHLECTTEETADGSRNLQIRIPQKMAATHPEAAEPEGLAAMSRVLKKYEKINIVDTTAADVKETAMQKYEDKFQQWKNKYYEAKFGWGLGEESKMRSLTETYVQGLQWVLYYYYRGVASWPWFFNYHYAPMISDVRKGLKANVAFKLGQPFRPFQQLMGVLPDRSKSIVPRIYHELMTSDVSPIKDFYPRDFELDMNGKKMEWEAIVKIPFIDEQRLLSAMKSRDALLSDDEKLRNEFGVPLKFQFSSDVEFTYPSSLVGIFPDIQKCHCVENIYELPTVEGERHDFGLISGAMLGKSALYGFPSLKTLPHAGALGFHGVCVFQHESRNESMVISLSSALTKAGTEEMKRLLGRKVHVGYPYLSEAKVVKISDEMFSYTQAEGSIVAPLATPHGPHEVDAFRRKADRIEFDLSKGLGILTEKVETLVHIEPLKGLIKIDDGALVKEYAPSTSIEADYALQTIVLDVINEDQRFLERSALRIEEEFPVASRAFFLGEFNYGRPLEVVGYNAQKLDVWISTASLKPVEFGKHAVREAEEHTPYMPSFAVARALGLNPLVLSKITSSLQVLSQQQRVNLGLNLKFEGKKLKTLGYSRRSSSGWEFSDKAVSLIRTYMTKFPEFVAGIQRNPQGNVYDVKDFYAEYDASEKIKEILAWLKEADTHRLQKVPIHTEQLDSDVVGKIETAANKAFADDPPGKGPNKKVNGVPRSALLKPSDAEQRLNDQKFSLGDRVVYVQDSGRVPIATRGTVIGKTITSRTTLLDIIFDVTFMSGTTLDDRCSPFRGSTVPIYSVLNLTDRQLVAGTKAAVQQRVASTYIRGNRNLGTTSDSQAGEHARWKAAPPPPSLTKSFSGALAGTQVPFRNSHTTHNNGVGSIAYRRPNLEGSRTALSAGPPTTNDDLNRSKTKPADLHHKGPTNSGRRGRGRGSRRTPQTDGGKPVRS